MKKLLTILPFLIIACQKNESVTETTTENDSIIIAETTVPDNIADSAANGLVLLDEVNAKTISKAFRVIDGDSIIKTINADMMPLTLTDEFSTDQQKYILKIKNFSGNKIVAKIMSEKSDMNIRFNQIKLANDAYDGPFGRDLDYDIKQNGEIWLIIGKSNMASGESKGKFSVTLK